MQLTPKQDAAAVAIDRWLAEPIHTDNWCFRLAGYAGTGKSTLVAHIISNLAKAPICCAPTGKAASVLRGKLKGLIKDPVVKTVHQVLYKPNGTDMSKLDRLVTERADALNDNVPALTIKKLDTEIAKEKERTKLDRVSFSVKPDLSETKGKLLVIDEASMISGRMVEHLKETNCKVLFVGDTFQLPPVNGEAWFSKNAPHAKLDQVMRQALESPIVRMSMEIRQGGFKKTDYRKQGLARICTTKEIDPGEWLEFDQVITGMNYSRQRINRFFRNKLALNHSNLPVPGDKMICKKNSHRQFPPWINGIQFEVTGDTVDCVATDDGKVINCLYEGVPLTTAFYPFHCLSNYDSKLEEVSRDHADRDGLFECDYAYAVTCHNSQGSEWPSVLIADDKMQEERRQTRLRWLYTAVTRAKERLLIVEEPAR